MNYDIFNQMQNGAYAKGADETEQDYMERVIRAVCDVQKEEEKKCFNDRMAPEFYSCSWEEQTVCLKFQAHPWQTNPGGTLHGGLIATAIDITFGTLARFYLQSSKMVTAELNINYMRAIQKDNSYLVCAKAKKVGRQVKFLHADVLLEESRKLAAEGTALFM